MKADLPDADLEARFGTTAVDECAELHPTPSAATATKGQKRKASALSRGQLWDCPTNIRSVLGPGKALTAEEICRQTGQMPERVAGTLAIMEGKGEVRLVAGGWEIVR